MKIEDIKIDEEFKNLCPGLASEELQQLRDNIVADGQIREPLIVWDGILIDGHNRLDVWNNLTPAERQKVSKPMMTPKKFGSREDAHNWIIDNQLGRRNLTPNDRSYLIGKRYRAEKKNEKENLKKGKTPLVSPKGQNVPSGDTSERIGEEVGKSGKQVKRDAAYSESLDTIEANLGTDAKKEAKTLPKKKVEEIAKQPAEKQQAAFDRAMGRGTPSGGNTFDPAEWGGTEESKGIEDGLGCVVPNDIGVHFEQGDELARFWNLITQAKKHLKEMCKLTCCYEINFQAVEADLNNAVNQVKPYRPYTECPKCRRKLSKRCDLCKGTGIISYAKYGSGKGGGVLTDEQKEWLANRG